MIPENSGNSIALESKPMNLAIGQMKETKLSPFRPKKGFSLQ